MPTISLAEAQARLPQLLEALDAGAELVVVENGVVLAQIKKPDQGSAILTNASQSELPNPLIELSTTIANQKPATKRKRWRIPLAAAAVAVLTVGIWFCQNEYRKASRAREFTGLCEESDLACRNGKFKEAAAIADRAIEKEPNKAIGYALRARANYFRSDEHAALADCDEALRREPNHPRALAYRALVAHLKNSAESGINDGERALTLDPDLRDGLTCLALAKLKAGNPRAAAVSARQAIERNPEDAEAHRAYGLALAELKDPAARAEFDKAVEHSGNQAFYLTASAEYLVRLAASSPVDQSDELLTLAAIDAKRAIETDPLFAQAHVAMAQVHASKGRWSEVNAECEKAIAINPRLVSAYIRAADNLSPRAAIKYQMLQESMMQLLDLRELKGGGDFAFGSILTDVQRLMSAGIGQNVPLYIHYSTFPPEQQLTLKDAKINLASLLDVSGENLLRSVTAYTILDSLCRQVDATFWVTPEHIEIVNIAEAPVATESHSRLIAPNVLQSASQFRHEQRRHSFEQALEQTIDLTELKGGGDFAAGHIFTDLQRLVSKRSKTDVQLYFNYRTFPPEIRQTIRDAKVNLSVLMDATGEQLLSDVKLRTILQKITRSMSGREPYDKLDFRFRTTADYIEIYGVIRDEPVADGPITINQMVLWKWQFELLRSVLGLRPTPPPEVPKHFAAAKLRPEAIRWLARGIESVPESAELYFRRGQIHLEMGDFESALRDFDRSIELNPGHTDAKRYRRIADEAKAIPLPKKAEVALANPNDLRDRLSRSSRQTHAPFESNQNRGRSAAE